MSEDTKIETKPQSFRLPIDVIETLQRWAEEQKQSMATCITNLVRAAIEDEKRITNPVSGDESVLQDGESAVGVIHIRLPKNRDGLADAITSLMQETQDWINDRQQISALGVARARLYKLGDTYQASKTLRDGTVVESIYEDEAALAERLEVG